MGQEKGEKFMSYLKSVTIIGFVGAAPEQRQARNNNGGKFTRTISHLGAGHRHAEVVEEHRRRMGLENRVASRLRVPPAARRISRYDDQERFARARRGQPRQQHVRTKRGMEEKRAALRGSGRASRCTPNRVRDSSVPAQNHHSVISKSTVRSGARFFALSTACI